MMDDALLRPGRLEVQIEIGLPKEKGRTQILHIHTKKVIFFFSIVCTRNLEKMDVDQKSIFGEKKLNLQKKN